MTADSEFKELLSEFNSFLDKDFIINVINDLTLNLYDDHDFDEAKRITNHARRFVRESLTDIPSIEELCRDLDDPRDIMTYECVYQHDGVPVKAFVEVPTNDARRYLSEICSNDENKDQEDIDDYSDLCQIDLLEKIRTIIKNEIEETNCSVEMKNSKSKRIIDISDSLVPLKDSTEGLVDSVTGPPTILPTKLKSTDTLDQVNVRFEHIDDETLERLHIELLNEEASNLDMNEFLKIAEGIKNKNSKNIDSKEEMKTMEQIFDKYLHKQKEPSLKRAIENIECDEFRPYNTPCSTSKLSICQQSSPIGNMDKEIKVCCSKHSSSCDDLIKIKQAPSSQNNVEGPSVRPKERISSKRKNKPTKLMGSPPKKEKIIQSNEQKEFITTNKPSVRSSPFKDLSNIKLEDIKPKLEEPIAASSDKENYTKEPLRQMNLREKEVKLAKTLTELDKMNENFMYIKLIQ